MTEVAAPHRGGSWLRRLFVPEQVSGWSLVVMIAWGLLIAEGRPGSPLAGALIVAVAVEGTAVLLWLSRPGTEVAGFWRSAPSGLQATFALLVAAGLALELTPWAIAVAVACAVLGLWGVVGVVVRVARHPVDVSPR